MPEWLLRSRSFRSAGRLRRHMDVPRAFAPQGRRDIHGWVSCAFGAGCTRCLEGSDIARKRWAEPRSLSGPQGGGSPRLTRLQAASGTMRIGIRTSRNRNHTDEPSLWIIAGVFCCPPNRCSQTFLREGVHPICPQRLFRSRVGISVRVTPRHDRGTSSRHSGSQRSSSRTPRFIRSSHHSNARVASAAARTDA